MYALRARSCRRAPGSSRRAARSPQPTAAGWSGRSRRQRAPSRPADDHPAPARPGRHPRPRRLVANESRDPRPDVCLPPAAARRRSSAAAQSCPHHCRRAVRWIRRARPRARRRAVRERARRSRTALRRPTAHSCQTSRADHARERDQRAQGTHLFRCLPRVVTVSAQRECRARRADCDRARARRPRPPPGRAYDPSRRRARNPPRNATETHADVSVPRSCPAKRRVSAKSSTTAWGTPSEASARSSSLGDNAKLSQAANSVAITMRDCHERADVQRVARRLQAEESALSTPRTRVAASSPAISAIGTIDARRCSSQLGVGRARNSSSEIVTPRAASAQSDETLTVVIVAAIAAISSQVDRALARGAPAAIPSSATIGAPRGMRVAAPVGPVAPRTRPK